MTSLTTLPWNLVTKNLQVDRLLRKNLRQKFWKRKELHQLKVTRFADEPQTEGTGPQKYRDVVRELFQRHYEELLNARRHIGLEAKEIAMVTGRPLKTVRESIASIQQRLREEMLEKALV